MLGEGREMETPPGESPFAVWEIPASPEKIGHLARLIGVRLGPNHSGEGPKSIQAPPPALRRVGVRGILDVPSAPGHVGYPESISADASLGAQLASDFRYNIVGRRDKLGPKKNRFDGPK